MGIAQTGDAHPSQCGDPDCGFGTIGKRNRQKHRADGEPPSKQAVAPGAQPIVV